ncbi:MAG TPA: SCO family protein [Anaerolineales bacterium]|nr:SCO family protein [Anaerolineales bacterium]
MMAIFNKKNSVFPGVLFLLLALSLVLSGCANQPRSLDSGEYAGSLLNTPAADFHLTDQSGASVSLSDFAGQIVVLTFFDSQCEETCPLTAVHLRTAYQQLGEQAGAVVFLGVNVNLEANQPEDVMATTQKWRLDEISTWHFLTGSAEELEPVWKAYDVAVLPQEGGEILHTPGVFLIDQNGQERWYISTPFDESGTPSWTAPLSELLVKRIQELLK